MRTMINGLSLHYELAGPTNGRPVVFVHGFPFSSAMWKPQVEAFSGEYQILTYDVRGHGESEIGDGHYLIEFFVDDLFSLLDHRNFRKAVICGMSMGGYIALRAVERSPERFSGLVLADTRSEADTDEAKLKRAASIRTLSAEGVKVFADGFLKAVFASESFQNKPETVAFIRGIIEKTSPTAIIGTLIALAGRTDTTPSLERIQVPTLIIVGERDQVTPPSAAEAMKKKIPDSELAVIRNAGHMSNLENHEAFNEALKRFLARVSWEIP